MNQAAIQASGLGRAFGDMWAVRGLDDRLLLAAAEVAQPGLFADLAKRQIM